MATLRIKILVGSLILGGGGEGNPGSEAGLRAFTCLSSAHRAVSASPRVITL